nr:cell surface gpi-anchored protein [Quercus suber]
MAARYLVPALAVAGRAAAQCSVSGTTTIQSQGDATALAGCSTFSGSIALATGTVGQIALDGIEEITGSLTATNVSGLASLSGDSLATIDDTFELADLTGLTNVEFPKLTAVKTITWTALTALQQLNMAAEVQMAESVDIEDTMLTTLTGINLMSIDTLTLVSNRFLNDITMHLGNVSSSLRLGSNGPKAAASFPNLKWANTLDLQNLTSIEIPSLEAVNGSLYFSANFFSSISAPNLTTIGGGLNIVDNANLTNVSMPELTTITQAFVVANNSQLAVVDDFGSLATISGTLDFYGVFTDVELPALKDVEGAFTLVSTDTTGAIDKSCKVFTGESGRSATIKVTPVCKGDDAGALTENNSTTTSSSDPSQSSTGAGNMVAITGVTGVLGVVAAIFGML